MDNPAAESRPGSAANPFILKDTPPKVKRKKKSHNTAPPSPLIAPTREVTPDLLEAVESRIRALEASIQANLPSPAAAGPSRRSAATTDNEERHHRRRARNVARARDAVLGNPAPHTAPRMTTASMEITLEAVQPLRALNRRAAAATGWRRPRLMALTHAELRRYHPAPPEQVHAPGKVHHKCGICHFVKSHPVSYTCGHSHCYVCIRLWLERKWTCPECVTPMDRAPFRQYAEEASIAFDYPTWNDRSVVDYSFEGLIFPKAD